MARRWHLTPRIWTPPWDQVRAVSSLLLLGKQKFRSSRCLPCRNGLDGDERRGSRRHTYLRPLSLEPTWAPGQDEIRTRGANRCATASVSQRCYRLAPVSVGPSSSVASFAFVGGKALTGFSQTFVSGRKGFRSVLNVELRLERHASSCPVSLLGLEPAMSLQRIFRLRRGDRPSHPISLALAAEREIVRCRRLKSTCTAWALPFCVFSSRSEVPPWGCQSLVK